MIIFIVHSHKLKYRRAKIVVDWKIYLMSILLFSIIFESLILNFLWIKIIKFLKTKILSDENISNNFILKRANLVTLSVKLSGQDT